MSKFYGMWITSLYDCKKIWLSPLRKHRVASAHTEGEADATAFGVAERRRGRGISARMWRLTVEDRKRKNSKSWGMGRKCAWLFAVAQEHRSYRIRTGSPSPARVTKGPGLAGLGAALRGPPSTTPVQRSHTWGTGFRFRHLITRKMETNWNKVKEKWQARLPSWKDRFTRQD